ncbi:MAG: GatB/YqeY domain-containing protein [Proteobacteria bacterium]|nr:GatB/YqeY domain-containing protein [Pseudomonadota bacterium]
MSIEEELNVRLKNAMRAKNAKELDVLRMVKTQAQAKKTSPGFSGEVDDAFWTDVIVRYVKQQKKALIEFEKAGDKGKEGMENLKYEIEYFTPFLPKLKGEDEVREIVKQAIAETGVEGVKMAGRVIGWVMKSHRDEVDAAMVKRIATEELG